MPRFGKGKPMAEQARNLLKGFLTLASRHAAKLEAGVKGGRSTGKIHSMATFNKYAGALKNAGAWLKAEHQVRHLDKVTPEQATAYLHHRRDKGIGQKQLDADRNALQFITGRLEQVQALKPQKLAPRAYSAEQVRLVAGRQTERNALSTELVYRTGLRAHELFTLKRRDEAQPFGRRSWHEDRFQGRDGVRYIVTGKGGLSREILIPHDLARRLEERRLDEPRAITDRGIRYRSHYAINGGLAWSKSFSKASTAALGRSNGGHGLSSQLRAGASWRASGAWSQLSGGEADPLTGARTFSCGRGQRLSPLTLGPISAETGSSTGYGSKETPHRGGACCSRQFTAGRLSAARPL